MQPLQDCCARCCPPVVGRPRRPAEAGCAGELRGSPLRRPPLHGQTPAAGDAAGLLAVSATLLAASGLILGGHQAVSHEPLALGRPRTSPCTSKPSPGGPGRQPDNRSGLAAALAATRLWPPLASSTRPHPTRPTYDTTTESAPVSPLVGNIEDQ